nr:probable crossover junction endonuclease EME2 isoform X3 [Pan paniscus]
MARVGPGRAGVSCQGRGRGRGGSGQRRPPTWEISDSDAEDSAGSEAAARARDPAGERRAAAEALRLLRPEQVLKRLAVCVDTAILEDAGADVLMEALEALGCECRIEPQRPARSLRWTRASPDPCPRSISGPTRWVPWISPETTARPHLAVIGLDAYLWYRSLSCPQQGWLGRGFRGGGHTSGVAVAQLIPRPQVGSGRGQAWAGQAPWGAGRNGHLCSGLASTFPGGHSSQRARRWPVPRWPSAGWRWKRQYRESQAFSFCTAGRWAASEPVARDGTGLQAAWRRQIRQFSRVSPAVADAVVTAFPSPRLLQQALEACSTERERMGLLADLPVLPSEGGRPRRVGPDLSRRICLFLTTANPDLLLDLGS